MGSPKGCKPKGVHGPHDTVSMGTLTPCLVLNKGGMILWISRQYLDLYANHASKAVVWEPWCGKHGRAISLGYIPGGLAINISYLCTREAPGVFQAVTSALPAACDNTLSNCWHRLAIRNPHFWLVFLERFL